MNIINFIQVLPRNQPILSLYSPLLLSRKINLMKKLLCLALLLSTSMAYANGPDDLCPFLKIKIKNNTPFTCQLVGSTLKRSITEDLEHLPLLIQSGTESLPFSIIEKQNNPTVLGSYGPEVTLSYVCGEGHAITIESTQTSLNYYTKHTTGTVVTSENMDASFSSTVPNCWGRKAGEINWILN
jgi:hypothetical protein